MAKKDQMSQDNKSAKAAKEVSAAEIFDSDVEAETGGKGSASTSIAKIQKPPKGFAALPIASDSSNSHFDLKAVQTKDYVELVVFRVPIDFPIDSLDGIELPLENAHPSSASSPKTHTDQPLTTLSATALTTKKGKKSGKADAETQFGLYALHPTRPGAPAPAGGEVAEMADFVALLPDEHSDAYRVAPTRFTRHFCVSPLEPGVPTTQDYVTRASEIVAVPYKAREHPDDMKPQYVPYGAETEGESLRASMERYQRHDAVKTERVSKVKEEKDVKGKNEGKKRKSELTSASNVMVMEGSPKKAKKAVGVKRE